MNERLQRSTGPSWRQAPPAPRSTSTRPRPAQLRHLLAHGGAAGGGGGCQGGAEREAGGQGGHRGGADQQLLARRGGERCWDVQGVQAACRAGARLRCCPARPRQRLQAAGSPLALAPDNTPTNHPCSGHPSSRSSTSSTWRAAGALGRARTRRKGAMTQSAATAERLSALAPAAPGPACPQQLPPSCFCSPGGLPARLPELLAPITT